VGMWESQTLFLTFPGIVCKVWENPDVLTGFFHAFPQYVISTKQVSKGEITGQARKFHPPGLYFIVLIMFYILENNYYKH
jgi:hypothetical protein